MNNYHNFRYQLSAINYLLQHCILVDMVALSFFKKMSLLTQYIIVFDISSSSVGVAIIKKQRTATPVNVLFATRVPIRYNTKTDAHSLGEYLSKAIKEAGTISLEALGKLSSGHNEYSIQMVLHDPWIRSQSKNTKGKLQKEMIVTKKLLAHFIKKHSQKEKQIDGESLINSHITQLFLNGYPTDNPYNKRAKQIEVISLSTSMNTIICSAIIDSLKQLFPSHKVHMDSSLLAILSSKQLFHSTEDFTLIDIDAQYSTVTVFGESQTQGTEHLNFGIQNLIDTLIQDGNMQKEQAKSELRMYLEDTCTPSQCKKIEQKLIATEQEFITTFGDVCTQLNKIHRLPTRTLVLINPAYTEWFTALIERIDFSQFTVTGHTLQVTPLDSTKIKNLVVLPKSNTHNNDLSLMVATLFTASQHQES